MTSDDWKMSSYIKFPQSKLGEGDAIAKATLKIYKKGGGSGPVKVHIASCAWSRSSLTYTGAEVQPGGLTLVSADKGDDSAKLPEAGNTGSTLSWTVEKCRLGVCKEITFV